jgi:hypothetical protein
MLHEIQTQSKIIGILCSKRWIVYLSVKLHYKTLDQCVHHADCTYQYTLLLPTCLGFNE